MMGLRCLIVTTKLILDLILTVSTVANSATFIADIAASSVLTLVTDGQSGTGAFGAGTNDYDSIASQGWFTIEKVNVS